MPIMEQNFDPGDSDHWDSLVKITNVTLARSFHNARAPHK